MVSGGELHFPNAFPGQTSEGSPVSAARQTPGTPPWSERIDKQGSVECTNRIGWTD